MVGLFVSSLTSSPSKLSASTLSCHKFPIVSVFFAEPANSLDTDIRFNFIRAAPLRPLHANQTERCVPSAFSNSLDCLPNLGCFTDHCGVSLGTLQFIRNCGHMLDHCDGYYLVRLSRITNRAHSSMPSAGLGHFKPLSSPLSHFLGPLVRFIL